LNIVLRREIMSFFNAAAPAFTEEDERAEREALSEEERRLLQQDIFGFPGDERPSLDPIRENTAVLEKSLSMLLDALKGLPDEVKASYLQAMECAPEVVEHESPPIAFLRCENYDPWAAAHRLVRYWTLRKQIFGADRAFLPMTLDGAMYHQDSEEVERHALAFPLEDDMHGRPVLVWNRVGAALVPRAVAVRCVFYAMSKMALREDFSLKGWVAVVNFQVSKHNITSCPVEAMSVSRYL
jgi:hypothetical protein